MGAGGSSPDLGPDHDHGWCQRRLCCGGVDGKVPSEYYPLEPERGAHEASMPIPRVPVSFEALGMVPQGWVQSSVPVPDGFLVAGGHAVVIEQEHTRGTKSVLL
eukprot:CAMPEP_0194538252 /NCGR_PEP_ID=MMETSP0253-20130528/77721_1 /TAXON_ID=2966 /ORGANISM="Noctiluca scintillans" /LENGTH=103 /DNA_ID=CAMNT_0039384341 /DNA_START=1 /DNA_END=308 /DNA_ORIENTATION=+